MKQLEFKILISSSRQRVWDVLWTDKTYRQWTAVFSPTGSFAETDHWKKGSKVRFLDGSGNGMVSTVTDNIPNELMAFQHLGDVKNGVEDLASAWSGSREIYRLKTVNDQTELAVEIDVVPEFEEFFRKTFPKALEKVKTLAEETNNGFRSFALLW